MSDKTIIRKTLCGCESKPMRIPNDLYELIAVIDEQKSRRFKFNGQKQDGLEIFEEVFEEII